MNQWKVFLIVLLSCFSIFPVSALETEKVEEVDQKFVFQADNRANLERDVFGSALLAGNNVTVKKKIDGIGLLAGNNVTVSNQTEYAMVAGNNIKMESTIVKDAFIAGNIVTFSEDSTVGRDLIIYGSEVDLSGTFGRNVRVYAAHVTIHQANIAGDVYIQAGNITIENGAVIKGELTRNAQAETDISAQAQIGSQNVYEDSVSKPTFLDQMWSNAIGYTGMLVIFAVLALLAPKIFAKINRKNEKFDITLPFIYMGKGAVALILAPMLMIFAFMTVIGVPLALLLLVAYIVAFALSTLFAAYTIGYWIWNRTVKGEKNVLLIGLLGVAILYVLSLIPVVNTIVDVFVMLMGVGVIVQTLQKSEEN